MRYPIAVAALLGPVAAVSCAWAQCPGRFVGFAPPLGGAGAVRAAIAWDPDGLGPLAARPVVGGTFRLTPGGNLVNLVMWDGAEWQPIGGGTNGSVGAMVVMPNGDLIVAGSFTMAGTVPAFSIARWNGVTWTSLSDSSAPGIEALAVLPNGDLIAGGSVNSIDGVPARGVARWDGAAWAPFGTGITVGGSARTLAVAVNGDLIVGGGFTGVDGVPAKNLARWDGMAWSEFGGGTNGLVFSVVVLPNGDLAACGNFSMAGSVPVLSVARWNGAWSGFPTVPGGGIQTLGVDTNGDMLLGTAGNIFRYTGTAWSSVAAGGQILTIRAMPDGTLLAGGSFLSMGGTPAVGVARRVGASWTAMGEGMWATGGLIRSMCRRANGDIIVAGEFSHAGGMLVNSVAGWNGASWYSFGAGLTFGSTPADVFAVAELPDGRIAAAGEIVRSNGVFVGGTTIWNGTIWTRLGTGPFINSCYAMRVLPNGDLLAAGPTIFGSPAAAGLARWDGNTWSAFGNTIMSANIGSLAVMPNGDVVASGQSVGSTPPRYYLARWNGAAWSPVGDGYEAAGVLLALPNGDLIVGGSFTSAGGNIVNNVARWDGMAWSGYGLGLQNSSPFSAGVSELTLDLSGNLIASGSFTNSGATAVTKLARWDGSAWSQLGPTLGATPTALLTLPDGDIVIAGGQSSVTVEAPSGLLRWTTRPECAADFDCSGSAMVGDIFAFLSAWFAQGGQTGPGRTADFNHDNAVTVADIFAFLTAWFAGC